MDKSFWKSIIIKIVNWVTRTRTIPRILLGAGAGLIMLGFTPFPGLLITLALNKFEISFDTHQQPEWIGTLVAFVGLLTFIFGVFFAIEDHRNQAKSRTRQRRFSIEIRGLNVALDRTIEEELLHKPGPPLTSRFLDFRNSLPQTGVSEICRIPIDIEQNVAGKNSNDVELYVGGLAAVPHMFLVGTILTNQSTFKALDWNRDAGKWSELDKPDDLNRFPSFPAERFQNTPSEVLLTISTSYAVNEDAIAETFGDMVRYDWELPGSNVNSHWSGAKQTALSAQFRDLLVELDGAGVRTVHLVLVSQASVALNFGRQLHRRNMPEICIYQYEAKSSPPYPWHIRIPQDETLVPEVNYS